MSLTTFTIAAAVVTGTVAVLVAVAVVAHNSIAASDRCTCTDGTCQFCQIRGNY